MLLVWQAVQSPALTIAHEVYLWAPGLTWSNSGTVGQLNKG